MIGTPLVGAWVAHVTFWVLLGMAARAGRARLLIVFLAFWVIGYVASGQVPALALFFMPYVAILDIALVFIVLKRDIRFG
jgi:hypothetical protein